jgi:hypothetical protein
MNLYVKVHHGSFHEILPKEYSGTFPELLWGKMIYYKMKCLLTISVSQILSLTRLIPEIKVICAKQTFYYNCIIVSRLICHFQPFLLSSNIISKSLYKLILRVEFLAGFNLILFVDMLPKEARQVEQVQLSLLLLPFSPIRIKLRRERGKNEARCQLITCPFELVIELKGY